jgi:hypothetical protein
VITYKRNDGVTLTGTLYLPANYDRKAKKEKLPLLIWAYPTEYKDKNTAGQNTQNPMTLLSHLTDLLCIGPRKDMLFWMMLLSRLSEKEKQNQ